MLRRLRAPIVGDPVASADALSTLPTPSDGTSIAGEPVTIDDGSSPIVSVGALNDGDPTENDIPVKFAFDADAKKVGVPSVGLPSWRPNGP